MMFVAVLMGMAGVWICLCRAVQMKNASHAQVAKYTLRFCVFCWFILAPLLEFPVTTDALIFCGIFLLDVALSYFNWNTHARRAG